MISELTPERIGRLFFTSGMYAFIATSLLAFFVAFGRVAPPEGVPKYPVLAIMFLIVIGMMVMGIGIKAVFGEKE
jgi:hypothetical protein